MFSKVKDESSSSPKTVAHLTGLQPAANREVFLLISAHLINAGNKKTDFANHFVVLRDAVVHEPVTDTYTLKVWTWGGVRPPVKVTKADIEKMYFGAIIGEQ